MSTNYSEMEYKIKNIQEVKTKMEEEKEKKMTNKNIENMSLEDYKKISDELDEKLMGLEKETIENMTLDELKKLNRSSINTKHIIEPDMEDAELTEYMRDTFLYFKHFLDFNSEVDELFKEWEKMNRESDLKLQELLGERGESNVIDYLKNLITNQIEEAKKLSNKELLNKALKINETFEDSFNLERIKTLYKNIGGSNTKEEAKCKANYIYEKYRKRARELELKNDLIYISDLEKKYLPENYHEHNNLFVFILMKYISKLSPTKGVDKISDTFFVSQLTSNLFLLYKKDGLSEEYKNRLLKNIQEVLDILI